MQGDRFWRVQAQYIYIYIYRLNETHPVVFPLEIVQQNEGIIGHSSPEAADAVAEVLSRECFTLNCTSPSGPRWYFDCAPDDIVQIEMKGTEYWDFCATYQKKA